MRLAAASMALPTEPARRTGATSAPTASGWNPTEVPNCIRSRRGLWRANYTPQLKKRTALQRKLKDVFRRHQSQPVDRVVQLINPILRGWVNYFAVGHSSECFSFIKDWVEKKVRRHMLRARKRKGFGWTRWSRQWLYETLRLFNGYRVRRPLSKVAPAG